MKSKEVKIGCNLAESYKESYGSKRDVFPMMIMMMLRHLYYTVQTLLSSGMNVFSKATLLYYIYKNDYI
jgi:hypothetical protein